MKPAAAVQHEADPLQPALEPDGKAMPAPRSSSTDLPSAAAPLTAEWGRLHPASSSSSPLGFAEQATIKPTAEHAPARVSLLNGCPNSGIPSLAPPEGFGDACSSCLGKRLPERGRHRAASLGKGRRSRAAGLQRCPAPAHCEEKGLGTRGTWSSGREPAVWDTITNTSEVSQGEVPRAGSGQHVEFSRARGVLAKTKPHQVRTNSVRARCKRQSTSGLCCRAEAACSALPRQSSPFARAPSPLCLTHGASPLCFRRSRCSRSGAAECSRLSLRGRAQAAAPREAALRPVRRPHPGSSIKPPLPLLLKLPPPPSAA